MNGIVKVRSKGYQDQKPGTSGLRKKVDVFQQEGYLENFVQAIMNALPIEQRECLVLGGDGRYFNREAIQIILEILVANGVKKVIVGQDGILSTPAVSHLIRSYGANGGIVLSASHNPGGPGKDFGIKFNNASGSPAPESFTSKVFEESKALMSYMKYPLPLIDLAGKAAYRHGETDIEIVDSVQDYVRLMQDLFDFDQIRDAIASGDLGLSFDAMHAVTGPYAKAVFSELLMIPEVQLLNCIPKTDFGGGHPDPNRVYAKTLYDFMMSDQASELGAASDGDGDRNMILGKGIFVSPSDSLALIAQHHDTIPQFQGGLVGVARSMPTSTALDRVAAHLDIPCFETPTGWKFFGNLLDAGLVRLCGEESFGTSGDHVREKDGVWTVLCWLSILANRKKSVSTLLEEHWQQFGRSYYCRHDYEGLAAEQAMAIMSGLLERRDVLVGQRYDGKDIVKVDSFTYHDPVDGSITENQGVRVFLEGGHRIVYRLSGTGTDSATLRVYLEQIGQDAHRLTEDAILFNHSMGVFANDIAQIELISGLADASVKT